MGLVNFSPIPSWGSDPGIIPYGSPEGDPGEPGGNKDSPSWVSDPGRAQGVLWRVTRGVPRVTQGQTVLGGLTRGCSKMNPNSNGGVVGAAIKTAVLWLFSYSNSHL